MSAKSDHLRSARRLAALLAASLLSLLPIAPTAGADVASSHPSLFTFFASKLLEEQFPEIPPRRFPPPPFEGLEDACGVALDSYGDVYISDYYRDVVDVFSPNTSRGTLEYDTQIKAEDPPDGPCGLAVDSVGDVYVNNWHRNVVKYTPSEFPPRPAENMFPAHPATSYGPGTVIDSGRSTGVVLDPLSGSIYVDDRTYVAEYEPSGVPVKDEEGEPLQIGLDPDASYYGVAVSGLGGETRVYVANATSNAVEAYDPGDPLEPMSVIDGAGTPQSGFHSLLDSSLAVDQSDGHLFVTDSLQEPFEHPAMAVDEFNPSGAYRGQISAFPGQSGTPLALVDGEPSGLTVDSAGRVYVTSGNTEEAALHGFGPTSPAYTLEVAKAGAGAGSVTSAPAGIACGSACAAEFNQGEALTLNATPGPGSVFSGWSGGGCSGTGTCRVTLNADSTVSAGFEPAPPQSFALPTHSVTAAGVSAGAQSTAESGPPNPPQRAPHHHRKHRHHHAKAQGRSRR
jgi:hypothetical protein